MAKGLVLASAALLAACGGSPATTPTTSGSSEELEDAVVNLLLNPNVPSLVTGTVAGLKGTATGSLYGSSPGQPSSIKGTFGGLALSALVSQQDQVPNSTGLLTTTKLAGSLGSAVSSLLGQFQLDGDAIFQKGSVAGTTRGRPVSVAASPDSSSGSVGSAATVSGDFGGVPFSLVANLAQSGPGGEPGTVSGSVGHKRIDLEIHPTNLKGDFSILRLTGTYSGPSDLLAIIVGVVTYFAA